MAQKTIGKHRLLLLRLEEIVGQSLRHKHTAKYVNKNVEFFYLYYSGFIKFIFECTNCCSSKYFFYFSCDIEMLRGLKCFIVVTSS